jgi:hypothetical protein
VTGHEDRDTATVVITAPVIGLLHGTPTREHRTGRVDFVHQVRGRSGRAAELSVRTDEPIVEPEEAVAAGVVRFVDRTRDVPVE